MPAASPPLPFTAGRLLSDMGMRPGRTTGAPTWHAGMDLGSMRILGARGTPVLNVQAGVVERVLSDADTSRKFAGYGNGVVVNHGDGTWALYAHLDRATVPVGMRVVPGQQLGLMGNTTNGKFRGMGVHLHLELRRPMSGGRSPFPGPYRTYNLDPRPWLESGGLRFVSRGGFQIQPGSPIDQGRSMWSSFSGLRAVGDDTWDGDSGFEPITWDIDPVLGLNSMEWAIIGASAIVLVGAGIALTLRSKVSPNRGGRRARRLRAWGEK